MEFLFKQYSTNRFCSSTVNADTVFASFLGMVIGSLSIVGVSILPYAEIEQNYFMNSCYVCIYKSMQSQKCGNVD